MNYNSKKIKFRRYREGRTLCPVYIVTPQDEPYIHTFYDICPWSPSGRLLLTLKLPFENREPTPNDKAEICIIDLKDETIKTIYETSGWALQTGAHQQWGPNDNLVYFNDIINGKAVTIEYNLNKNTFRELQGPIFHLSPDGSYIISPSLNLINLHQRGYGVPEKEIEIELPPQGARADEGLWITDVKTGEVTLLVSFKDIVNKIPEINSLSGGWFLFFHTKFNNYGNRIMQVVRYLTIKEKPIWDKFIITFKLDGSDMKLALKPEQWALGGHHPNWHSDGKSITMNLKLSGNILRFYKFLYDGSNFQVIREDIIGSGHPSISGNGKYIITDAYVEEGISLKNDEVPIRLFDVNSKYERNICYIRTICDSLPAENDDSVSQIIIKDPILNYNFTIDELTHKQSALDLYRLDPHPVWNRDFSKVCFNGAPNGKRQVMIADIKQLLK